MKRFQGFFIGVFATLVVMASIPNFAETINVVFNSINLRINGVQVAKVGDQFTLDNGERVPYSIIYKGTTYLPLKNIGQTFGKNILWDSTTRTVSLNDPSYQETPKPSQDIGSNNRSNPANLNETIIVNSRLYTGEEFELQMTLKEIMRGDSAWQLLYSANRFNTAPTSSQEIVLAKFNVKVTSAPNNNIQYNLTKHDFNMVSQGGKDYEFVSYVLPSPVLDAKLYNGASNEGWIAFLVDKSDLKPVIVNGKSSDGTGGVWFKGYDINQSSTNNNTMPSSITRPTNASELKTYLNDNYSVLNTVIGQTEFSFSIIENTSVYSPEDYWIMTDFDFSYFSGAMSSIKYSDEQKNQLKSELKAHQEKLAKDVISLMPDKKMTGGYYTFWYRYPNIKVDLVSRRYFTWTNYEELDILTVPFDKRYSMTTPSSFRWYDFIDDEL